MATLGQTYSDEGFVSAEDYSWSDNEDKDIIFCPDRLFDKCM